MSLKQNRIMIIDKNGTGAYILTAALSKWGYDVVSVNSYLKAIEYSLHNAYQPELIIVETQEVNAIFFEFPRKFLERTKNKVPMIVYSVNNNAQDIKQSLEYGYKDYIVRPVEPEILKDKIKNFVKPEASLNQETFQFKIHEEAKIIAQIHIESLNEFGLEANIPYDIHPSTVVTVQSPTLIKYGINEISVRLVESKLRADFDSNSHSKYRYHARFSYVAVSETEIKKIRKIAMTLGQIAA
jgi:twitching motility two-component system response regulator PilH